LGRTGTDTAWHGALSVSTTTTQGFREAYKKELASYTIFDTEVENTTLSNVWLVTTEVRWANAAYAKRLMPLFLDLWRQTYNKYTIKLNTLTGCLQLMKVQAPQNISPAQVRQVVGDIAVMSIAQTSLPSVVNLLQPDLVQLIQPPDITVTNSALV
jgi:hypothetical protein